MFFDILMYSWMISPNWSIYTLPSLNLSLLISSRLVSASIKWLKVRFRWSIKENWSVEHQWSFSKSLNEKPWIRWIIGSFPSLSLVRISVFPLIYCHVSSICNLGSQFSLISSLILVFVLLIFKNISPLRSLISPRILIQIEWFLILWIRLWVIFLNPPFSLTSITNSLSDLIKF